MNWITDRLPKTSAEYWVTLKKETRKPKRWVCELWFYGDETDGYWQDHVGQVVAWMPKFTPTTYRGKKTLSVDESGEKGK